MGRAAAADDRRRELPRLPRGHHGTGDDAALPRPGRALRRAAADRAGRPGRALERGRRRPFGLGGDTEYRARTVVLSMGAEHKKLGISGEEELSGRGVSYCATCDAAFFRDVPTIIVGGGDSAMEEAIFLSKFASKVIVVHRRDEFRASKIMLERAREQENIEFLTPYSVKEFVAGENGALGHAVLENTQTGETRELPISGTFIAVGHEPQSEIVAGQVRSTRTATSRPTGARRARTCPASSRPATSWTTPIGRRSRRPRPAARRRSTPSGTCATRPGSRHRRACRSATPPKHSGLPAARTPPSRARPRAPAASACGPARRRSRRARRPSSGRGGMG